MNAALQGSCLLGMGIFVVFSGPPAHSAEGPLLVVVEAPPALDADAAEIRRAIGVELRSPTIAPMQRSAEPPGRALIVAFDRDRIAMSLRTNDSTPIVRDIPAPNDRAARLRAIAWLAGNLARDQVTPLVAEAAIDMPSLATIPPATTVTPATEPPPLAEVTPGNVPPGPLSDVPTISTPAGDAKSSAAHFWTIGAADGPTSNFPLCTQTGVASSWPHPCAPLAMHGTAWRLELQRRTKSEGFFQGAALEGTAGGGFSPQLIGVSAFVGSSRRHGKWTFESTVGAGLELSSVDTTTLTSTHSSEEGFMSSVTTTNNGLRPALSADGAVAAAHPVSESLDAVLRVGAHVSTNDLSDWFLSVTLGLRYNLL
jgi:hypothetical protein